MKTIIRTSLTAAALAAVLGLTACGGGEKKEEQQPQPTETQAQHPTKPAGYTEKLEGTLGLPSEWNESAGWKDSINSDTIHLIGDYLAYSPSESSDKLIVVDGKGEKKFTLGASDELESEKVTSQVVSKKDKQYLVVVQSGKEKLDASSVKKADTKSIIKVLDKDLKEIWSETVLFPVEIQNDAIVVQTGAAAVNVFDASTGEESTVDAAKGKKWVGRFDGTDIYAVDPATDHEPGTITSGSWSYKAATAPMSKTTKLPQTFGSLLVAPRYDKDASGEVCDVLDPETGRVVDLGTFNGGCLTVRLTSPDKNFIFFEVEDKAGKTVKGILSLSDKKVFEITSNMSFDPSSISNSGTVYGSSGSSAAVFNFRSDTEPKKVADAKKSPVLVADNGIAVFEGGVFAVKKDS